MNLSGMGIEELIKPNIVNVLLSTAIDYDELRYHSLLIFKYSVYSMGAKMAINLSAKDGLFCLWLREIVYLLSGIVEEDIDEETYEARQFAYQVIRHYEQKNAIDLPVKVLHRNLSDEVVNELLKSIKNHVGDTLSQSIDDYAITAISIRENKVNEYGNLRYIKTDQSEDLVDVLTTTNNDEYLSDYPEFFCIVNRKANTTVKATIENNPLLCYDLFFNLQLYLCNHRRPYKQLAPTILLNSDVIFNISLLKTFIVTSDSFSDLQPGDNFINQLLSDTKDTSHTKAINAVKISLLNKSITFV
ncbi:hypothetical protein E3Q10_00813 [Wallemia mellicola]|uniref:Uncharacterized protein n=1 Tax=Wallemia mellicola TaxID=1708541 RepID=A0A4T0R148_9BASI|nr:hypothetical protein E3Q11_01052 [Wallemia mellicola]TIC33506.1 hypothetical protein E3Q10_00813 [Wallemia mellicola]